MGRLKGAQVSNINEVIRAILNLFISFLKEDFAHTKSTIHIQANKNKKDIFYVHKKHLRGRKLLVWRFVHFVSVKSSCEKKKNTEV